MSSFLSIDELKKIGLKSFGQNVFISKNAMFYNPHNIEIGSNVRIDDFCILSGKIKIGSYVHIGAGCYLYGAYGIEVGDFSGLSPRCTIFSAIDDFSGKYLISPLTMKEHNNLIKGLVKISSMVQLGVDTIVFPDLVIEEGVATGANTLVRKNLDSWNIYAGQDCKRIKAREKDIQKLIKYYA